MKAHQLGQKRHKKALARKSKKYTGPKYSRLEQMLVWAPILQRAGIDMFAEQMPEGEMHNVQANGSATSFV